jgi:hypothetical protein
MESRLRKLEDRFRPPPAVQLRAMCAVVAERSSLDVDHVHHEAQRVLERMWERGPQSLEALARDEGIDPAALRQGAMEILAQLAIAANNENGATR